MYLLLTALRRPATVMVVVFSLAIGCFLAVGPATFQHAKWPYPAGLPKGMEVDIFPKLNLPVIYVCQPYGGMDPAQMEGFLTNYTNTTSCISAVFITSSRGTCRAQL